MARQNSLSEIHKSTSSPQDDNESALNQTSEAGQDRSRTSLPLTEKAFAKPNAESHSYAPGYGPSREPSYQTSTAHHRTWQTTFIRVGPLSGLVAMLFAMLSIVASLGVLAGSSHQPVRSWSSPPSTYLALFTALANLSIRYAAIQGVVVAWWYRALSGSTLSKLHYEWRAGTTLKGALTSGRRMGLLGVACIFSTVVVIDGPLLQRSSTVILGPIVDRQLPLKISLAPQIPHDYSGQWGHWGPPVLAAFNDTVPTIRGNATNHIMSYANAEGDDPELTRGWYDDSPLASVVEGCVGESSTSCQATIYAPAFFPTCITRSLPIDATQSWDWKAALAYEIAAPPYALGFTISLQLLTSGAHESINLVVANSDMTSCTNGTLHYTICELVSGIGAYDVDIIDDKIQMKSLPTPRFEARSNNTHVNSTIVNQDLKLHPSTLAGIVYISWQRFVATLFRYTEGNRAQFIYEFSLPYSLIVKPDTVNADCPSYLNLTDEVLSSLNNLAVRTGAQAAKNPGPPGRMEMDPGLSLYTKASGQVVGQEDKYRTDYRFFAAAAIVEVVCIALILPTYWGWWKIGRPVSLSPLETAKAFGAPLLAGCNSNSSGRDIANVIGEVRVQYGARAGKQESGEERAKLAFSDPACIDAPTDRSRYDA